MQLQPQIDCFWQKPIEPSPSSWNRHRICKLLLLHLLWTAGICYTQSIQCVDAHHVDWFYISLPNFTTSNFPLKVQDCLVVPQWMNTTHNNDYVPKRQRSTVTLTLVYFSGNLPSVLSCVCLFFPHIDFYQNITGFEYFIVRFLKQDTPLIWDKFNQFWENSEENAATESSTIYQETNGCAFKQDTPKFIG